MAMPSHSWLGAAASFLGAWTVMMAAMMLPSLTPTLWRYRRAAGATGPAVLVGAGYFAVWTALGAAAYPLGAALGALARGVPAAAGVVIVVAGAAQFTAWKGHHLARCREAPRLGGSAWRDGVCLGLHCVRRCANLMAILLVVGMMDLRAMLVVTAAITVERLAPFGERAVGVVAVAAGVLLIARA